MLNQIPPPTFSNQLISMAQRPLTSGHLLRTSFPICKMGCSPPRELLKGPHGKHAHRAQSPRKAPLLLGAGDGISSARSRSFRSASGTQDQGRTGQKAGEDDFLAA